MSIGDRATRMQRIEAALRSLEPSRLELVDQSHQHAGHAGARDGRGHFDLRIVATCFQGLPLLSRHRRVYAALGDLMTTDIHALSIQARSPEEEVAA